MDLRDQMMMEHESKRETDRLKLVQRNAELEAVLQQCDAMLEYVWPHFGGQDAAGISALQERIAAVLDKERPKP